MNNPNQKPGQHKPEIQRKPGQNQDQPEIQRQREQQQRQEQQKQDQGDKKQGFDRDQIPQGGPSDNGPRTA